MYNCFFGIPYRRNFPYHSAYNRNPQPVQPKRCDQQPNKQNKPERRNNSSRSNGFCSNGSCANSSCANKSFLKCSSSGGIFLPENTDKNATYTVASINLDTSAYRHYKINFNFACSIATVNARMHLRFQLFKQEKYQLNLVPVSSSFAFTRNEDSNETNVFTLTACDFDSMESRCCNYRVNIEIMGFDTVGTIMITNPILIAYIIETDNEIV